MLLDLHTHSSVSDGSYSPERLIDLAKEKSLHTLALCDHDTTAGLSRFTEYGQVQNITVIPGIELSATWSKGNCHILGLGLYKSNSHLESVLGDIRESRDFRNEKILKKLQQLQVPVSLEEVKHFAGGDVVARPHIAQTMCKKGYVKSVQEAFDSYLAKNAPAYVDRYRLEPEKAIMLLREAGSIPVLAHPSQLNVSIDDLENFIKKHTINGLAGIEVFTPYTADDCIKPYSKFADDYNLFCTGGSDFHGTSKPNHRLGYYRKDAAIPEQCAAIVKVLLQQEGS